jgi:hypothetical protein
VRLIRWVLVFLTRQKCMGRRGGIRETLAKYITGYIIRTMRGRRAGHTLKPR